MEIEVVQVPADKLFQIVKAACKDAVAEVLAAQGDELLNIKQLCERIPGLSYHTFVKLRKKHNMVDINGKYSIKAVTAVLQSQ